MRALCVGIDVGSTICELLALEKLTGEIVHRRQFDTSQKNLIDAVKSLPGESEIEVHLEACTLAAWVRRAIKPYVKRVWVSHPKSNAWIAKDPLKNDKLDAHKLAQLLRMGQVHDVYYPDEQERETFKQVVQHYDRLTDDIVRTKVTIKARLSAHGILQQDASVYTTEGRKSVLAQLPEFVREAVTQLYDVLDAAERAHKEALRLLRRMSSKFPEIARFEEVPGVGLVLACRFSACIATPDRFSNKRKLWRYCRLGIAHRSSDGKPLNHQKLDYNGCGRLKDLSRKAFMAAQKTKKPNAFQRSYETGWKSTGNKTHARLTVQRKIVTVLWTLWKKKEDYREICKG